MSKDFYISNPDQPLHPDDHAPPSAASICCTDCGDPGCEAIHILLLDENDNALAQATIGPDVFSAMVKVLVEKRQRRT